MNIKKITTLILCLLFPARLIFWILNLFGHRIHPTAKIGFSFLWIDGALTLHQSSKIGHLNFIKNNGILIESFGYIGNFNRLIGPFEVHLAEGAAIGNSNKAFRSPLGVTYGKAILKLGKLTKITANHRVDCTRSINFGEYSIIAGHDTQLWTHAYYHDRIGPGRFRLDGDIEIGNNVYIGSRCIINGAVRIADNVTLGANSCVSKSLLLPGVYVNQPLRYIEHSEHEDARSRFRKINNAGLCEEVYEKEI